MGFLQKLGKVFGAQSKAVQRAAPIYSSSGITNQTMNWLGDIRSADAWMRFDFERVRARSRQMERGNPWMQSFDSSFLNNVLGARGIQFEMDVRTSREFGDNTEGELDSFANTLIERKRKRYERPENFTARKTLSRREADRLILHRWFFDGEVLIRKLPLFDNEFRHTVQIVEPEYLDHNLNRIEPNGNVTKMGVELDRVYRFPVAYWLLTRHPGDYLFDPGNASQEYHVRVPASEMFHIFVPMHADQTRGWPLPFAALAQLNMEQKHSEAALVNAAVGASKMGFFKKNFPVGFEPETDPKTGKPIVDDQGAIIDSSEPGSWTELPYGVEPVSWNPQYPDAEYSAFNKAMLRGIAGACRCSYMTLTGDLSEANFSSLRAGLNEEREQWMAVQEFFIENWKVPEFDEWLYRSMLSGEVKLPIGKFEKFNAPLFTGRRWSNVNPLQDEQTNMIRLDNRTHSVSEIIRESGRNPARVFDQIQRDEEELARRKIQRVHSTFQIVDTEKEQPAGKPTASQD